MRWARWREDETLRQARRGRDAGLERLQVDGAGLLRIDAKDVVEPGEHGGGEIGVPLVTGRAVRLGEEARDALAHRRRVAVARQIDQARDEAAVRLDRHEQSHAAALLQLQDADRDVEQSIGLDLEQVVAGIVLENGEEIFLVVARGS